MIKKFAHSDYRDIANITYYKLPLRTEGGSDGGGADNKDEWPTARLDNGRAVQMDIRDLEERQKYVSEWVGTAK